MPKYSLVKYRGVWSIYWREGGKPIRRSTGLTDKAAAQLVLDEVERQDAAAPVKTFTEIWGRYKDSLGARPAARQMGYETKAVLAFFGNMRPEQIDRASTARYIAVRRKAGRKDGTILTELNRVAAALNWARGEKLHAVTNALTFPPRPQPRDRYLTRTEVDRMLAACLTPHTRLFVVLALTTGARHRAILGLTWDRVDMDRRLVNLQEPGHSGKARAIVPMNNTLHAELEAAYRDRRADEVVSWAGRRVASMRKTLENTAARAGLKGVTAHVFRHTAAVWMAEAGRPMSEIAQFLGHADDRVTQRVYARYSPDYLRHSASALEL